jgi:hypothetical protein
MNDLEQRSKRAAAQREWRRKNPEAQKAIALRYWKKNRAKINAHNNAYQKKWRKENPEAAKAKDAAARQKHWERRRKAALEHYQRNKEKIRKEQKKHQRKNKARAKRNFKRWYQRNKAARNMKARLRRAEERHFAKKREHQGGVHLALLAVTLLV